MSKDQDLDDLLAGTRRLADGKQDLVHDMTEHAKEAVEDHDESARELADLMNQTSELLQKVSPESKSAGLGGMVSFPNATKDNDEEKALIDRISALNPTPIQCQSNASELDSLAAECGIDASSFKFSSWTRWDLVVCTVAGSLGGLLPNIGADDNGLATGRGSFARNTGAQLHDAASQVQPADGDFLSSVLGHKGDLADRIPEDVEAL